jgi:hypothetical protein
MEALAWLAQVDVAGLEPLACALGFGWRATYSHVERLAGAGLVERVYDRGGSVVAITRRGRIAVDADPGDVRMGAIGSAGIAHSRAMSWVAAFLTLRGRRWIGERDLMRDAHWRVPVIWMRGGLGSHRPDLVSMADDQPVAIEVELSPKARRRLRAILTGYDDAIRRGQFTAVTYIAGSAAIGTAVRKAVDDLHLSPGVVRSIFLEDVYRRTRELSGSRKWPGNVR